MFGACDKIRKRVLLLFHAAGVMPGLPQFAAAANVRDREDHSAIQEAQTIRIEIDGHGDAVAAVAVKQQRRSSIARCAAPIDHRDRHLRAVGRRSMKTLTDVLGCIVAAEHWLLLAKHPLALADVVIKDGTRSDERFVLKAYVI